jgi:hypothetical protein
MLNMLRMLIHTSSGVCDLFCWVISWVVLLWYDVCSCNVVVWLRWCGIRMRDTRTRTYICLPLPQPVVTPPTPPGHSPSHWLRHFPTTTPSGINTPHVPSQSFFIHLPMKMEPIEGSETSAVRTKTPGNYPKESILRTEHGESLKSRKRKKFTEYFGRSLFPQIWEPLQSLVIRRPGDPWFIRVCFPYLKY